MYSCKKTTLTQTQTPIEFPPKTIKLPSRLTSNALWLGRRHKNAKNPFCGIELKQSWSTVNCMQVIRDASVTTIGDCHQSHPLNCHVGDQNRYVLRTGTMVCLLVCLRFYGLTNNCSQVQMLPLNLWDFDSLR